MSTPLSDWLEEDLAELEAYGCPCSCKAPEETGTRHGYTCPWHRAMQSLRRGVARLTAESEGRRAVLERKSEELRQEWTRAEAAEAEVARLTAERDAWRDPVLDGWAVYSEIPEPGRYPMGADGVSLVLDAVARLARRSLTTEGGDRGDS